MSWGRIKRKETRLTKIYLKSSGPLQKRRSTGAPQNARAASDNCRRSGSFMECGGTPPLLERTELCLRNTDKAFVWTLPQNPSFSSLPSV